MAGKITRKIIFVTIILLGILTIGVIATKSDLNYVTIAFSDDSKITVMTNKISVSDILDENHIIILPDEEVYPDRDSNIDLSKKITITKGKIEEKVIAEEIEKVTTEEILGKYVTITEKIITEQIEIPFETVTKDVSVSEGEKVDKVVQNGVNGLKEVRYKIKYQEEQEIERKVISEQIIKPPVDKIIQISTRVTSRSGVRPNLGGNSIAASVEGQTPRVVTLNATAYSAATCGKPAGHPQYGITAAGVRATSYYTVAAGPSLPMGTVIYIPYFADKPNGGWFVVQDRGGAISDAKLDVYFDTIEECRVFGRRNLECHIYQ